MKNYLRDIIDAKKKTIEKIKISGGVKLKKNGKSFVKILETKSSPVIIAEIKKASPSRGIIREDFNFDDIFRVYEQNKLVDAISILTEEIFFLGNLDFVKTAVKGTKPILRKDFIFSEKQVYETSEAGADIMLLIAAILSESEYKNLYNLGKTLNLEIITEIHNLKEYKMVSKYNPEIIGVNNRNLDTFEVSLEVSESIIKEKNIDAYYISESGIKNSEDIRKLYDIGFKGFLIGESIMKNNDINSALNGLLI
ncbi:MAG TPA: indole-3-glycerol-phosphate synthase [bacterium]|nr:indole-3-glycerol-phosphate synthase [bacterium]HPN31995.1 indole-3-glycerol-phosphate synthase [bacterium]